MSTADRTFWQLDDEVSNGRRVRSLLSDLVFLFLLVVAVIWFWLWGPKISVVLSESMNPTYTAGDALLVVPWGTPGIGDIAQFRVPLAAGHAETTVPVTHRIIGQDESGFITKGDNPTAPPDYWRVTPDMIDGQVLFWMPRVWMFRIASGLIGLALLLFLWPRNDENEITDAAGAAIFPWGVPISYPTGPMVPSAIPQGRPLALPPPVPPHGRPVPLPPPAQSWSRVR